MKFIQNIISYFFSWSKTLDEAREELQEFLYRYEAHEALRSVKYYNVDAVASPYIPIAKT